MHTKLKKFLLEKLKYVNKGFASHLIRLDEYKQLIEMTNFIKNGNIMERIYHVINDFPEIPICKGLVPSCNGVLKFQNLKLGYQKYCCKCFTKSPEFSKKMSDAQKNRSPDNEKIRRNKISKTHKEMKIEKKEIYYKKRKNTVLEKYGPEGLSQPDLLEKKRLTCIKKYGTDFAGQSQQVKEKYKQNSLKKWGYEHWMKVDSVVKKNIESKKISFQSYANQIIKERGYTLFSDYNNAHNKITLVCPDCTGIFDVITWNYFQQGGGICPTCNPKYAGSSVQENVLSKYISTLTTHEIIRGSRKIIPPYQLDIFIPELKLAVEYCGLYFHSTRCDNNDNPTIPKDRHIKKLDMCLEKGIRLITIFEDEWILKQDIVKERLKYILKKSDGKKIRASKCDIKIVKSKEKNIFLEKYHIQGKDNSVLNIGLYYENQLVSIMTFTHGSPSKGQKHKNLKVWELNRFCTSFDYIVYGSAQKLLKFFQANYDWDQVFSYADRRWSLGTLYEKLNFKLDDRKIFPNYWYWGRGIVGRKHRFGFTKSKLKKSIYYSEYLNEQQIMSFEKRYSVYDCGNLKYILSK